MVKFKLTQRLSDGVQGIVAYADPSGDPLNPLEYYWVDGSITDYAENSIAGNYTGYNAVKALAEGECKPCLSKGCETSCYEKEVGGTPESITYDTTNHSFADAASVFISTDGTEQVYVGAAGNINTLADYFQLLYPQATVSNDGTVITVTGDLTIDWVNLTTSNSASVDAGDGSSGKPLELIDDLSSQHPVVYNPAVAGVIEAHTACMWYACDADGNPDPSTIQWRDSKMLEAVDVDDLTECVDPLLEAINDLNDNILTLIGDPDDECPCVDNINLWLLLSKFEIGDLSSFTGIVQVGDFGAGAIHPSGVDAGNAINGWNAYAICSATQPADDNNNHYWLAGSVDDYSITGFTRSNPDPSC